MPETPSFRDHVDYLSSHLRASYDLNLVNETDGGKGAVVLKNEMVEVRFHAGWPKDPYVDVSIAYADSEILGGAAYFELWRYIKYKDDFGFFPIRYPDWEETNVHKLNRSYGYPSSPFMVMELVAYLTVIGEVILRPDREAIRNFMDWKKQADREYNERVSKPR